MSNSSAHVFKGSLLIAGTTIGGGMLALPVLTAQAGFLPSCVIYFLCWGFMAITGLLFLEVSQWLKGDANIISMAKHTLGRGGQVFAWILYLFLFYCLSVAYTLGCGQLLADFSNGWVSNAWGPPLFVCLFAPLTLVSTAVASRLNVFFVLGLIASYFGFVVLGFSYVNTSQLLHANWSYSLNILPIAFISFAYQGIIPTLAHTMEHDKKAMRQAVLIGSFIPFIVYTVWEWLILGIIPLEGAHGLIETQNLGQNAIHPFKHFVQSSQVYFLGRAFAFLALFTSFIGVSLGLRDFLADGLHIRKTIKGKILLALLVFVIPLIIAIMYPGIFLTALEYAGGFGSALLLGLLPIMMVWRGRYQLGLPYDPQIGGGKTLLLACAAFVVIEVLLEMRDLVS